MAYGLLLLRVVAGGTIFAHSAAEASAGRPGSSRISASAHRSC